MAQSAVSWNKGQKGLHRPAPARSMGTEVKARVCVDSQFYCCIVVQKVCGSKEGKQPKKAIHQGWQETIYVTMRADPSEALSKGLQGMRELTSAGPPYAPSLLYSACTDGRNRWLLSHQ